LIRPARLRSLRAAFDPGDAIDVNCRNLRDGQPGPVVSVSDDHLSPDAADDDGMVVIRF
jgi:hypothetical protein